MLGGGGLDEMRRPIMLLVGTNDNSVGAALEYRQAYETLPGPHKTRVLFENADHMIFGNACPAYPGMVDAGLYFVCSDLVWDMDRAHDLTNHFATAFLLAELKGDAEAAKALAPENVAFPGITYETTAYGAAAAKPARHRRSLSKARRFVCPSAWPWAPTTTCMWAASGFVPCRC